MDKKNIKYVIIALLVFSVAGYYLYQHATDMGLAKPTLVLKISTNLSEKGAIQINNVTFVQSNVPVFYKRADTIPSFPEIEVNARLNALDSAPASFWASTPFDKEEGLYEVKIYFRDGKEPKTGDVLIMPIRIVGSTAVIMYKTTAFYEWE
ncbi:hypothetical protein METP3_02161 [Methanosarcinales archaeon]|nr:hypothetical protein METP3_02161 [Methanosarcinales archaeon]